MTRQTNLFSANNDDLPLISGTCPRGKTSPFVPEQASRQLHLPEHCATNDKPKAIG